MTVVTVVFCMTLNGSMCRTMEMAPIDHATVSVSECIKGGAIAGMTFELEHIEWQTKGWHCTERPNPVELWQQWTEGH